MTCHEADQFLSDYVAGTLPPAQRRLFDAHLAECDDCEAYLQAYRHTILLGKAAFCDPDVAAGGQMPAPLVDAILHAVRANGFAPARPS